MFALRLKDLPGYADTFDTVFSDRFSRVLGTHHMGKKRDNPHYHFVFECDYKRDALVKYFKKTWTQEVGNKHMSIKSWDGDVRALSYLFHEDSPPVIQRGFTDEEVASYIVKDKEIRKDMVTPKDVIGVVVEKIKKERPQWVGNMDIFECMKSRHYIFCEIFQYYYKKGDWMPNRFQMEKYINKVRVMIVDEDHVMNMCEAMYQEWFK